VAVVLVFVILKQASERVSFGMRVAFPSAGTVPRTAKVPHITTIPSRIGQLEAPNVGFPHAVMTLSS
jgi:hypothetical protein